MKEITYQEFVNKYKTGEIGLTIDPNKAGDFILSKFANKHNKPAHLFWTWTGVILIPLSIFFIFIHWQYAIISFIAGALIINGARKSACQFVAENMVQDEKFWFYVLFHNGAIAKDKEGNTYSPNIDSLNA
jgi:hypothetical protein